jgi:uncharacterized UBP type Zn finger protein
MMFHVVCDTGALNPSATMCFSCECCRAQDAKRVTKFINLPPVLEVQLKRFAHDSGRDGSNKVCALGQD